MEIEFKCPHCGVVTYFDASHLGKTWPCRGCGDEAEISEREYGYDWDDDEDANFTPFSQPAFEDRNIAGDDEIEVIDFRGMQETSRESESRTGGGPIALGLVLFATIFIAAGPILLHSMQSPSYPTRKPTIKQQDFRAVLERLENSQKSGFRGRMGPNSFEFSDPHQKALFEEAIKSGKAIQFDPRDFRRLAPP